MRTNRKGSRAFATSETTICPAHRGSKSSGFNQIQFSDHTRSEFTRTTVSRLGFAQVNSSFPIRRPTLAGARVQFELKVFVIGIDYECNRLGIEETERPLLRGPTLNSGQDFRIGSITTSCPLSSPCIPATADRPNDPLRSVIVVSYIRFPER